MATKRRLGKGINALIPDFDDEAINNSGIKEIRIYDIDPNENQPRQEFDQEKLEKLAQSIKQHGIIQPLVLVPHNGRYRIVVGERRWRAAKTLGIETVPAVIKELGKREVMEIALIENLQREDLNPIEEANALKTLIDEFKLTQDELAERIGRSRPAITNTLRLLALDEQVKSYLTGGYITSGHARCLLSIEEKELQRKLAEKIINSDLTVRETEKVVKTIKNKDSHSEKPTKKKEQPQNPIINEIESTIQNILGTRVKILQGKKVNKIEIEYYSDEDLDRIYDMFIKVNT